MRLLRTLSIAVSLVALVACGGTKATVTPIPSAGALPLFATFAPTNTAAASTVVKRADVQASPTPLSAGTPTPLATPASTRSVPATAGATKEGTAAVPTGTPPRATQPTATAQPVKPGRLTDVPTGAPQQVIGTAADGLTLLNLRTGKNDGFTRLVFDVTKHDGSAAPVPRTRVWMQGSTVVIAFGGVRDDLYATSLGGGEQPINLGIVQSVYRIPVRDDAAAAYGIATTGPTHVTLSSATLPTRVIVDIADK